MKNSILLICLVLGACSDPPSTCDLSGSDDRFVDLNNRIEILESENAALTTQVRILQGQQNIYIDNYVGLKIKIDLLSHDLCPKCDFDLREPTPRPVEVRLTPQERKEVDDAVANPLD